MMIVLMNDLFDEYQWAMMKKDPMIVIVVMKAS
jgi:hypothetical protein